MSYLCICIFEDLKTIEDLDTFEHLETIEDGVNCTSYLYNSEFY